MGPPSKLVPVYVKSTCLRARKLLYQYPSFRSIEKFKEIEQSGTSAVSGRVTTRGRRGCRCKVVEAQLRVWGQHPRQNCRVSRRPNTAGQFVGYFSNIVVHFHVPNTFSASGSRCGARHWQDDTLFGNGLQL